MVGLEPTTSDLSSRRSTTELHDLAIEVSNIFASTVVLPAGADPALFWLRTRCVTVPPRERDTDE